MTWTAHQVPTHCSFVMQTVQSVNELIAKHWIERQSFYQLRRIQILELDGRHVLKPSSLFQVCFKLTHPRAYEINVNIVLNSLYLSQSSSIFFFSFFFQSTTICWNWPTLYKLSHPQLLCYYFRKQLKYCGNSIKQLIIDIFNTCNQLKIN